MADLDAVNLGLDEADMGGDLEDSFDTRSEASGSSSSSSNTGPSISSVSTDNTSGSPRTKRRHNVKRSNSNDIKKKSKSVTPELKRSKFKEKSNSKSYDYMTKLNYLFRDARFFVIKSNNAENIALSKTKGVWSTLPQNEANLNQAFRESRNVLLIFSVKESGKFAGFARMCTESRRGGESISWVLPAGLSAKTLGGVFKLDWICRKELSFTCTGHLFNPWNDGKPVKIGRDGQEIETKVGSELCRLFPEDERIELLPILKKSKEASKTLKDKNIVPTFRPPHSSIRGGPGGFGMRGRGGGPGLVRGRKKIFLTSRGKMGGIPGYGRPISPFNRERIPQWDRYSSTAAAEAYVADYMRTMQHQLPPMPYAPPPGFSSLLPYDVLPPPRYYDGLPGPEYPPPQQPSRLIHEKRSYDRSVDDFMWKSSDRSLPPAPKKSSQPNYYPREYSQRNDREKERERGKERERNRERERTRDRNHYRNNDKDRNHRSSYRSRR